MSALSSKDLELYDGLPTLKLLAPDSLAELEQATEIEVLSIQHFPKIHSLQPLSNLDNLRALFLSTTPSWDGTKRNLLVDTFEPLAALHKLELIQILGVVPERDRLRPLHRLPCLAKVSIGNTGFYQLEDFAEMSVALPRARPTLQPIYQMNFVIKCRKCGNYPMLFLAGVRPRSPRYVCPACGRKKNRRAS